jgi:hypothetical protein
VQGVFIHVHWAERYGVRLSEERKGEVNLRAVARQLERIRALDDRPLTVARPAEKRLVGNCRDYSVFLCAILRHQRVPARARCGFGTYFTPGRYEDHWVCEYWDIHQKRWIRVDSQLDAIQRRALKIRFDPLDVPADDFLTGGRAWRLCRGGQADPDHFGIFDMHGLWFVLGDMIRDLLALNKVEILPWDEWGHMLGPGVACPKEELLFLDRIAGLTEAGDEAWEEVRAVYEGDPLLRVPEGWKA